MTTTALTHEVRAASPRGVTFGTLFGQEFRTTRKPLALALGIGLGIAVCCFAVALVRIEALTALGLVFGVLVTVLFTPTVMVLLAVNYWRTMYGREGYFTMTIPVRGRMLFAAKVTYGFTVGLITLLLSLAVLLGAASANMGVRGADVAGFFTEGLATMPAGLWVLLPTAFLLQVAYLVVAGASLMSIGAQARFNRLGFGAPVIGAILLYIVVQIVSVPATLFVPFGIRVEDPGAGRFVTESMFTELVATFGTDADPTVVGLGALPLMLIITVALWWWGSRAVDRHTSLR